VIEIYNDQVIDLLREGKVTDSDPKLVVMDTPEGVIIPALHLFPISSEDEAYTKISEANLNRAVAEHQLNRRSSRSHAIYSFYVTQSPSSALSSSSKSAATGGGGGGGGDGVDVIQSKLHLVDLAGSERIEKTGSTGGLVKEATHINKSLSFLEQVVLSLGKQGAAAAAGGGGGGVSGSMVASYRQSKLTYILKDSLGGNCNT
jgi:kinesin family protein 6/9